MLDLNERIPNDLSGETEESLYAELASLKKSIEKKFVEISTVKLIQYLKNNIPDYVISLEVIEASGLEMDWDCYINPPNGQPRDYEFSKTHEDEIIKILTITSEVMIDWYYCNKSVEFVNDETGRDTLISYMIGDNWEIWKKAGENNELDQNLSKKVSHKLK